MARARTKNVRGQGDRLRRELLDAANAILDERNDPAAVTVRGVAAAVGVAPNAVYLHFADREELLAAVVVDRFQDFGDRIRAAIDAAGDDPRAALRAGNRAYIEFAVQHPGHYRLLMGRGELAPDRKDLQRRIREVADAAFDLCVEVCRRCVEAGVAGDVDPVQLALTVWLAEHGYADLAGTQKGAILPDPDAIVETVLAAAAAGAQPRRGSQRRARAASRSA